MNVKFTKSNDVFGWQFQQGIFCLLVFLLLFSGNLNAQRINLTGVVLDISNSEYIPGASIRLKGKSITTITNSEGKYSISVANNDVLIVSYLGYTTQEIPVNNRSQINISLVPSVSDLEGVVITGYGAVQKGDLTGAISSVKLKDVNELRATSFTEALQGKLAGVNLVTNTGEPGGAVTFNIRGMTSITGSNQPLIVIDGQPIESSFGVTATAGSEFQPADPLAMLNPNDIASIEVLKDATSTALYGSRGANGVVLITTKSGAEGRDRITFSARTDVNKLPKQLNLLTSYEYMMARNEGALNDGIGLPFRQDQLDSISRETNIDYQKEVFSTAIGQDYQLSLSGKEKKHSYLLSGNYADQKSLIRNAGLAKGSLRLNYEREVTPRLRVGLRTFLSLAERNFAINSDGSGLNGTSVVLGTLIFSPLRNPYDETGEINEDLANSPLLVLSKVKDRTSIRTIIANFNADYKVNNFLTFTARAGVNDIYAQRNVFYPTGTVHGDNAPGGAANRGDNSNYNFLTEYLLTYRRIIAKKHSINATGAYSYQKWFYKTTNYSASSFPSNTLGYYFIQGADFPGGMQSGTGNRALQAFIARVNYTYDKKYLLTLTGRYDGSTRLAPGNKWQMYPSLGLGWNAHQESFFKNNIKTISSLKLRASVGVAGNDNVGIGRSQSAYALNQYPLGSNIAQGYVLSRMENPFLRWERTLKYNAGADLGLFKERLTFTLDWYRHETTDLLIGLALPTSSGYGSYNTNIGKIINHGLDIEASYKIKSTKNFSWDVGGNISLFNNKVDNLGNGSAIFGRSFVSSGEFFLGLPVTASFVGQRIVNFYGYKTNGIYQNQSEIDNDPALSNDPVKSTIKPGMIRYVDTNNDGKITGEDRTIIGSPMPDFTFGLNSSFRYKKLSVNFTVFGNYGRQMINLNRWALGANQTNNPYNLFKDAYLGRWRGEGTSNLYPALTANSIRLQQRLPDWMVEDASFVRLQNVTLGYSISLPKKYKLGDVKVFLTGTNLFTITKYSGYDPNVNAFGHESLNSGVDFGTLPQARSFSMGATFDF